MAFTYKSGSTQNQTYFVPAGTYTVKVIEATEVTSKSGNDMIKLKLRVILRNGHDGPALFDYLVVSESAGWKIDQFLGAMGKHPGEDADVILDADEMVGWEGEAELSVEEYNSKKSNKVAAYLVPQY
jgi:hypothetical protein